MLYMIREVHPAVPIAIMLSLLVVSLPGCATKEELKDLENRLSNMEAELLQNDEALNNNMRILGQRTEESYAYISGILNSVKQKTDKIQLQQSAGMCALSCGEDDESILLKSDF
jgi:uncharacterized lipoprotein YehR (DUF1307 family)